MSELKVHVGAGASLPSMGKRFAEAWHRAERSETVDERHLSFGTLQQAASVLTPRRLDLLRQLHREPATSVRTLAARLNRDYSNVHADVRALIGHGLIDQDDAGTLTADYDGIAVDLALAF